MTGRVLNFSAQTNSGAISGDDGLRYTFTGSAWMDSTRRPMPGAYVDFETDGNEARAIYLSRPASGGGGKPKTKPQPASSPYCWADWASTNSISDSPAPASSFCWQPC